MLSMELVRVRETGDLAQIEAAYLEFQRIIKTDYAKLEQARDELYIEALNGQEEAQVNGYQVTYRPLERFAFDSKKLETFCSEQGLDIKEAFYSHQMTKPSLKLKTIKN